MYAARGASLARVHARMRARAFMRPLMPYLPLPALTFSYIASRATAIGSLSNSVGLLLEGRAGMPFQCMEEKLHALAER
jgi:hypothetical protein